MLQSFPRRPNLPIMAQHTFEEFIANPRGTIAADLWPVAKEYGITSKDFAFLKFFLDAFTSGIITVATGGGGAPGTFTSFEITASGSPGAGVVSEWGAVLIDDGTGNGAGTIDGRAVPVGFNIHTNTPHDTTGIALTASGGAKWVGFRIG